MIPGPEAPSPPKTDLEGIQRRGRLKLGSRVSAFTGPGSLGLRQARFIPTGMDTVGMPKPFRVLASGPLHACYCKTKRRKFSLYAFHGRPFKA